MIFQGQASVPCFPIVLQTFQNSISVELDSEIKIQENIMMIPMDLMVTATMEILLVKLVPSKSAMGLPQLAS